MAATSSGAGLDKSNLQKIEAIIEDPNENEMPQENN